MNISSKNQPANTIAKKKIYKKENRVKKNKSRKWNTKSANNKQMKSVVIWTGYLGWSFFDLISGVEISRTVNTKPNRVTASHNNLFRERDGYADITKKLILHSAFEQNKMI